MEKIRLKLWQKVLLISIGALLALLVLLNTNIFEPKAKTKLPVTVEMNVDLQPADTTDRAFSEGIAKGDSVRFERIEGGTTGWIFQVFSVTKEFDYTLLFDLRNTDHLWKKGDSLIFCSDMPGMKSNNTHGVLLTTLQSRFKMSENSYYVDEVKFWKYYVNIHCLRYDSLASFNAVYYAEQYLKNPDFSPEKIVITGNFKADSIKIGTRIVN